MILWTTQPTTWYVKKKSWLTLWYVPQLVAYDRILPFTVRDFLDVFWSWRRKREEKNSIIDSLSTIVEILLDTPFSGLSWWQRQKILIYNALRHWPQVLLLDEPTAGLDVWSQEEFYRMLDVIHDVLWCTIIMVSHDIHTVYNKSDQVICLHQWVCCVGKPDDDHIKTNMHTMFWGYLSPYKHHHG